MLLQQSVYLNVPLWKCGILKPECQTILSTDVFVL
jgi:hypothetical protein